jgi:hypothetical protein
VEGEGIKPKNGKRKSTIAGLRRDGDFMAKDR